METPNAAPEARDLRGPAHSTDKDAGLDERGSAIITASTAAATIAAEINTAHALATGCAKEAVQHAIRCGELLIEQKKALAHGEFSKWIEIHCAFAYSTAARYMRAAEQNSTGVEISSLSAIFPSGASGAKRRINTDRKTSAVTEVTPARHERELRVVEGDAPLMSGAPSFERGPASSVGVDVALKGLKAAVLARQMRSPACVGQLPEARATVTRLRNQLARAELTLAELEKQVLTAYRELKAGQQ